ncbi:MAG: deoxyribose-phosphate aldolase [Coprobacillaceae bacterium]
MKKNIDEMTEFDYAQYLDYAVLKPDLTLTELKEAITLGVLYQCRSICVNPGAVDLTKQLTKDSNTKVCVVLDFPFGTSDTKSKVEQAKIILEKGNIFEIDMVANYGLIKSGEKELVTADIEAVSDICHQYGVGLKVILETDALTREEISLGISCAIAANADFVKTSTGFYMAETIVGASPEIITFMLQETNGKIKVKGSGCIRTRERMLELISLGVDRLGIGYTSVQNLIDKERL